LLDDDLPTLKTRQDGFSLLLGEGIEIKKMLRVSGLRLAAHIAGTLPLWVVSVQPRASEKVMQGTNSEEEQGDASFGLAWLRPLVCDDL
jgi:hypothetical protein